jgi:hypothetical protein
MGRMPERPAVNSCQFLATPMPKGETMPSPVTTTFFMALAPFALKLAGKAVQEIDGRFHGFQLAGLGLFDLNVEFIFESHDQLDHCQAVGTKLVKALFWGDVGGWNAKLVSDNFDNFVLNAHIFLLGPLRLRRCSLGPVNCRNKPFLLRKFLRI